MYELLATVTLIIHFLFIIFVIFGGLLFFIKGKDYYYQFFDKEQNKIEDIKKNEPKEVKITFMGKLRNLFSVSKSSGHTVK